MSDKYPLNLHPRAYVHALTEGLQAQGACEHVTEGAPPFAGLSIDGWDGEPVMEALCLQCVRDLASCGVACYVALPPRDSEKPRPSGPTKRRSAATDSDVLIATGSILAPLALVVLMGRLGLIHASLPTAVLWIAVLMDVPSWLLFLRDTLADPISAARSTSWAQALVSVVKLSLFMAAYWLMDAGGAALALVPWITITVYRAHLRSQLS